MAEITKEERIEISKPDTVYCNKFYFLQNNSIVKIICCETSIDSPDRANARFSMAMSIVEFQCFVAAANDKMADLNKQIEAFKAQAKQ